LSTQETNLRAIAEAIRQKEGSTGPIPASSFADRILALPTGGSSSCTFAVPLIVTVEPDATVTAINGGHTVTGTADAAGSVTLTLPAPGIWEVTAELEGEKGTAEVDVADGYAASIQLFGSLPFGYTELQYILSSGTQYIDTGINATTNTKLYFDYYVSTLSSETKSLFGCFKKEGSKYLQFRAIMTTVSSSRKLRFLIEGSILDYTLTVGRHSICFDSIENQVIYDNKATAYTPSAPLSDNPSIYLFSSNGDGAALDYSAIRLYSCTIYENSLLVRDFVPCKDPNGAVGLYDKVSKMFYANKGTGNFTPGPAV